MIFFDTDAFVEILSGNARFIERAANIPLHEQAITIVTVEEILRGRLHAIRRAETTKGNDFAIVRAYELLGRSADDFRQLTIAPYSPGAHRRFLEWREQKVRVSTHDLRIAAISVDHTATLVSRNRRDFGRIAGLAVEFWN